MKTIKYITILLLALVISNFGFGTSANISVSRTQSATIINPGDVIDVTLTVNIGSIGASPIRGFYITEYVPNSFTLQNDVVKIGGTTVSSVIKDTASERVVYTGYTAKRWVLETPPDFLQNRPLNAGTTVTVQYQIKTPGDAVVKTYPMPGFSWVALIPAQGDNGDNFGYEAVPPVIDIREAAPTIAFQPTDVSVQDGLSATFSVDAAGGNLIYQWRKNGTNISGANTKIYTTPALTLANNGEIYDCFVHNGAGQVYTRQALLQVNQGTLYVFKDNRFKKYATLGAGNVMALTGNAATDGQKFQKLDAGGGQYWLKVAGQTLFFALGTGDQLVANATSTSTAAKFQDNNCSYNGDGGLGVIVASDDDADKNLKSQDVNNVSATNGSCAATSGTAWERFYYEVTGASDLIAPSIPAGVVATTNSTTQITLNWNASTDNVAVTGYTVEYRLQAGTFTTLVAGTTSLTAVATGLNASSVYEFRVSARDAAGNVSAWSAIANATTQTPTPDTQAPTAPASVIATASGSSLINLAWTAATDNIAVTGYNVEYRLQGGTFATLVSGVTALTASATSLTPTTTYEFRVNARDAAGNISAWSAIASATTGDVIVGQTVVLKDNRFKAYITIAAANQAMNINGTLATAQQFQKVDVGDGSYYLQLAGQNKYIALGANDQMFATATTTAGAARFIDRDCANNGLGVGIDVVSDDDADRYFKSNSATEVGATNGTCNAADATAWERFFYEIIGASDVVAPSVPSNVVATASSSSQINVSWAASTDNVAVTGYTVEYRIQGGTFAALIANTTALTASATGLNASTVYEFRINARDAAGNISAWSTTATATTQAPPGDIQAPTVPSNVSATASSSSLINVVWTASTDNVGVTGYTVEYRVQGGTFATLIAGTTALSASATGLIASTAYEFRVNARDAAGNISVWSTTATATTQAPPADVQAPTAPTNVVATASSSSQINVVWAASTDNVGVTGYTVEYRVSGGTFAVLIANTTALTASATGLAASTAYEFRVSARDAAGNVSVWSTTVTATTQAVIVGQTVVLKDNRFKAYITIAVANSAININGTLANAQQLQKVDVGDGSYYLQLAGQTKYIALGANDQMFATATTTAGAARFADRACANNGLGTGIEVVSDDDGAKYLKSNSATEVGASNGGCNAADATAWERFFYESVTPSDAIAPTTPTNVSATTVSPTQINITWSASTDNVGVTGYTVEQRVQGGTFAVLTTTANTSASATGLTPSTTYEYRVFARDAAGNLSTTSTVATATTAVLPPDTEAPSTPTNVSATAVSQAQINLTWSASTDNVGVTGYTVEQRVQGGTFAVLTTTTNTSVSATGLTPSTSYEYRLSARDAAGNSSILSAIVGATTPAQPTQPVKATLGSVSASSEQVGNGAANSIDGNMGTRWAADGKGQWIQYQLPAQATLTSVKVAFYAGAARKTYFEIQTSNDGLTWTTIGGAKTSSGATTSLEEFDLPDTSTRWVRYLGQGNSANTWNSIFELEAYVLP